MKGLLSIALVLIALIFIIMWVISHSFLIVSVGPVLLVLIGAIVSVYFYLRFKLRSRS